MEEALKMRNLLQEFLRHDGVRYPSILGVREHIFTGRLVTWFFHINIKQVYRFGEIVITYKIFLEKDYRSTFW